MWSGSLSVNTVCGMWIIRQKYLKYLTCYCKRSNHGKNETKLHNVSKETAVTTLSSTFLFTFLKVYIKNCVHICKLLLICHVTFLSLIYSTSFYLLVWCHPCVGHNVVQSSCFWKKSTLMNLLVMLILCVYCLLVVQCGTWQLFSACRVDAQGLHVVDVTAVVLKGRRWVCFLLIAPL